MSCELEDVQGTSGNTSTNIASEASTQTPTNEQCDSPMFTQKGHCLKTNGHSNLALSNIQKMRQHGQVNQYSFRYFR